MLISYFIALIMKFDVSSNDFARFKLYKVYESFPCQVKSNVEDSHNQKSALLINKYIINKDY